MFCIQPKTSQRPSKIEQSELTTKKESIQEYISERVFKDKSQLCRIAIPYVIEEQQKSKPKTMKQQMEMSKAEKKCTKYQSPSKSLKLFKPTFNYEKAPVNEYLNYQLSEQINEHLKEVKYLADEIKQIKQLKRKEVKQVQQKKNNKKNIRIRRTNFKNSIQISASTGHLR